MATAAASHQSGRFGPDYALFCNCEDTYNACRDTQTYCPGPDLVTGDKEFCEPICWCEPVGVCPKGS